MTHVHIETHVDGQPFRHGDTFSFVCEDCGTVHHLQMRCGICHPLLGGPPSPYWKAAEHVLIALLILAFGIPMSVLLIYAVASFIAQVRS